MISSNSVSSFGHRKTSKPAKQRPVVQQRPNHLSKLPRAILALLASTVKATGDESPIVGISTTALEGGGFVITWATLDKAVSARTFTPDGIGGFIQGELQEVRGRSAEEVRLPASVLSGQISASTLPDQIPVDKLPTIPDSKIDTITASKLRGTIPIETLPIIPDEKLASISSDKLNGTLPMQALPAAALYHNPIGSVVHYPTDAVPEDYLECNGQTVLRDAYPELFGVIGVTYGPGDSVSTFRLPDYRGQFLRGWNHGSSVDTDCDARTNRGDGTTGDAVGTRQDDEFGSHSHNFKQSASVNEQFWPVESDRIPMGVTARIGSRTASGVIYNSGGSETRPKNIAVMYIIRAK